MCGFHNYDPKLFLFHHYNNGILKWLYFLTKVAIWCDENFFSIRNLDGKLFFCVQEKTFLQGLTIRHMKNKAFFTKEAIFGYTNFFSICNLDPIFFLCSSEELSTEALGNRFEKYGLFFYQNDHMSIFYL